ncbi:MAG: cation diffusion facilitator family transporter, partial [Pseudomonadota bacterium]
TQALIIVASALFVIWEGARRMMNPEPIERGGLAIAVMTLSIVLTAGLAFVQTRAIRATGSLAIEADRAHYLGDLGGNLAVLLAVALAAYGGYARIDALAGLAVAGFLLASAGSVGRKSVNQLMDRELPSQQRSQILRIAMAHPDVAGVHALRTRRAGRETFIQLHLELPPEMQLARAHAIADAVEQDIMVAFPKADVLIHQDPHGRDEAHDAFGRRPAAP